MLWKLCGRLTSLQVSESIVLLEYILLFDFFFQLLFILITKTEKRNEQINEQNKDVVNRPFPSSGLPHLQSESKCEVFVIKISFHSYVK